MQPSTTSNTIVNAQATSVPKTTTIFNNMMQELSMCGYHRARVQRVSQFDRLAGGFSWALSKMETRKKFFHADEEDDEDDDKPWTFVEFDDKHIEEKRCDVEHIIKALEDIGCPHKITLEQFMKFQLVHLIDPLTWLLRRVIEKDSDIKNYSFYLEFFDTFFCKEDVAIFNFRDGLMFPNENRAVNSEHISMFGNAIIFNADLSVQCILAEYVNYSQTGIRVHPGHMEDDYVDMKSFDGPSVLGKLASALFSDFEDENLKNVYEKVSDLIEKLGASKKISASRERFIKEAREYHKMKDEYHNLKDEYAFKNFDVNVDSHKDTCDQVNKLLEQFSMVHDATAPALAEARHLEKQIHFEICIKGNPKYCPHKRELLDKQIEKRKEIETKFNQINRAKNNLTRCFEKYKSDHDTRIRLVDVEEPTEPFVYKAIDQRLPDDASLLSSLLSKCILDLQGFLPNQEHECEFVDAAVAYVSDVRNLMTEWFFKAKLMVSKRQLLVKEMKVMRQKAKTANRNMVLLSNEYDSLFHLNMSIQNADQTLMTYMTKN